MAFDDANWKIVAGLCAYTALAIAIIQVGGARARRRAAGRSAGSRGLSLTAFRHQTSTAVSPWAGQPKISGSACMRPQIHKINAHRMARTMEAAATTMGDSGSRGAPAALPLAPQIIQHLRYYSEPVFQVGWG